MVTAHFSFMGQHCIKDIFSYKVWSCSWSGAKNRQNGFQFTWLGLDIGKNLLFRPGLWKAVLGFCGFLFLTHGRLESWSLRHEGFQLCKGFRRRIIGPYDWQFPCCLLLPVRLGGNLHWHCVILLPEGAPPVRVFLVYLQVCLYSFVGSSYRPIGQSPEVAFYSLSVHWVANHAFLWVRCLTVSSRLA